MTRRYDDPVDVRRRDDVPAEFLWRGRVYLVRGVLAHWLETGPWWTSPAAQGAYVGGEQDPAAPAGPLDPGEREVWRVEAQAGRVPGVGVFDLCFDWGAGAWTLGRALD